MKQLTELVLPDFFSLTPFTWRGLNPIYDAKKRESTEWMLRFGVFSDHKLARLKGSNAEILGAYTFTYADAERMRICCDFLMILFLLDEITDAQDTEGAKATRDTFVKALTGNCGDDKSQITLFTTDYLKRLSSTASKETCDRFVNHCIAYIEATATEARIRENNETMSIEEYTDIRRDNGGVRPCFDLIEVALGITLPAGVVSDPNFLRVYFAAVDMICWANDAYSYPVEYTTGVEGCSSMTVLMQTKDISLQEAMDQVAEIYKGFAQTILTCKEKIRSYGPEADDAIRAYIYGLEQWVYGNLVWSFASERYFGKENEEVKRTGVVKLRQRNPVM